MTERRQFRAIKGTRDILPPDSALWNWFEHTAREVFESYNFGEIRLPAFEQTELFARSIGTDTDVVSKEMYTFEDRSAGDLARLKEIIPITSLAVASSETIKPFMQDVKRFTDLAVIALEAGDIPRDNLTEIF